MKKVWGKAAFLQARVCLRRFPLLCVLWVGFVLLNVCPCAALCARACVPRDAEALELPVQSESGNRKSAFNCTCCKNNHTEDHASIATMCP